MRPTADTSDLAGCATEGVGDARLGDRRDVDMPPTVRFLGEQRADQVARVPPRTQDDHTCSRLDAGHQGGPELGDDPPPQRRGESASCMFLCASSTMSKPVGAVAGDAATACRTRAVRRGDRRVSIAPTLDLSGERARPSRSPCSAMSLRAVAAVLLGELVGVAGQDDPGVGVAAQCGEAAEHGGGGRFRLARRQRDDEPMVGVAYRAVDLRPISATAGVTR